MLPLCLLACRRVVMSTPLIVGGWNVNNFVGDRPSDVAEATQNFDLLCLQSTGRKRDEKSSIGGRMYIESGFDDSSPFSNRSCGCGILCGRRIKEANIVNAWPAPKSVAGRGVAALIRSGYFYLCPIVMYFPQKPKRASAVSGYNMTVKILKNWANEILRGLSASSD